MGDGGEVIGTAQDSGREVASMVSCSFSSFSWVPPYGGTGNLTWNLTWNAIWRSAHHPRRSKFLIFPSLLNLNEEYYSFLNAIAKIRSHAFCTHYLHLPGKFVSLFFFPQAIHPSSAQSSLQLHLIVFPNPAETLILLHCIPQLRNSAFSPFTHSSTRVN